MAFVPPLRRRQRGAHAGAYSGGAFGTTEVKVNFMEEYELTVTIWEYL